MAWILYNAASMFRPERDMLPETIVNEPIFRERRSKIEQSSFQGTFGRCSPRENEFLEIDIGSLVEYINIVKASKSARL